jgi:hypothetical protein
MVTQHMESHCWLTRPMGEWLFMDVEWGLIWLAAKLNHGHVTGSRDIQNGRIPSGQLSFASKQVTGSRQLSRCEWCPRWNAADDTNASKEHAHSHSWRVRLLPLVIHIFLYMNLYFIPEWVTFLENSISDKRSSLEKIMFRKVGK